MISAADLARLKELCEKATPGPWTFVLPPEDRVSSDCGKLEPDVCYFGDDMPYENQCGWPPNEVDRPFIAEARTWLPRLVEEVEKLRERERERKAWYLAGAISEGSSAEAIDKALRDFALGGEG